MKAVIFDMDGTLVESDKPFSLFIQKLVRELDHDFDLAHYHHISGNAGDEFFKRVHHFAGETFPIDRFKLLLNDRFEEWAESEIFALKPGVVEIFDFLDSKNIPYGVATSSEREHAKDCLEHHGLFLRLKSLVGGDEVTHKKPHPEPYLRSAQNLGVHPSDMWVIEDSLPGIRSGRESGASVIMVPNVTQPNDEIMALVHVICPSLLEAKNFLELRLQKCPTGV